MGVASACLHVQQPQLVEKSLPADDCACIPADCICDDRAIPGVDYGDTSEYYDACSEDLVATSLGNNRSALNRDSCEEFPAGSKAIVVDEKLTFALDDTTAEKLQLIKWKSDPGRCPKRGAEVVVVGSVAHKFQEGVMVVGIQGADGSEYLISSKGLKRVDSSALHSSVLDTVPPTVRAVYNVQKL
eukprot:gnl/TRDRNA2_/TRDRNA2_194131_c0_seq1.p1 gnl/TRDRNA2_/TRDRNA2_194131_c0~~gnl/TRDRNA2_/TRDRNA2_194131_c0_seq1.p1  ORF type:complete len:199 (-),score=21.56 gnl/TRDRNA2_/TRDRNA2_194131_c0_seq1:200-757(-)